MSIDRRKRITFEENADLYNEARHGYPEALVEDVLALSGISPGGRILEIGCGPGNATLPYARRGYEITAVELGKHLSALAAQNLSEYPKVQIINTPFEDWPLPEKPFHLVISAEAMHWIPPEIGYPKVAQALHHQGSAAFYWNMFVDPQTDWSQAIDAAYQALAPQVMDTEKSITADWLIPIIVNNFRVSDSFDEVTVRRYAWSQEFTATHYINLLRTSSVHRDLDENAKKQLFTEIKTIIERYGGSVTRPGMTVLFHAKVQK